MVSLSISTMEGNILKRDRQQFHINEELDLRTRLLMKEAECILKDDHPTPQEKDLDIQHNMSDIASNIYIPITVGVEDNAQSEKKTIYQNDSQLHSEPELRFLRAKVKILTTEIEKHREDSKKKIDDLKNLDGQLHTVKEERNKAMQQLSMAENKVARLTNALSEQANNMKMMEAQKTKLTQELAAAKKDTKFSSQSAATMELRMNRALEEVESLKTALQRKKGQEKDEQDMQKKTMESQATIIQKLERQQTELILAFRRQLMLCHNFQRQRDLEESKATLNLADSKFTEMLESKRSSK